METTAKRRVFSYLAVGGGLTMSYAMLRGTGWHGGAQLHTLMEGLAFLLAMVVGALALVRFYAKKNNTFLFIGTGFFGTALLDGYHAVVTSAFFAPYLPSDLGTLIPWSWVASRLFLSALLCLSWLAWKREQRLGAAGRFSEHVVYLITGALTLASFLFFAFVPLPRAYYPEIVFHRPEEFVPTVLFLVALVCYLRKGEWRRDAFEHWLVLSLIVGFISQAVFMSFSGKLFDLEFDAAHLLKKVSYVCVLIGLLLSMYAIFRQAEEREAHIRETSKILGTTIENFPGGLSVFDAGLKLVAFNRSFVDLLELPQDMIEVGFSYEKIIRFNAERGEYGKGDVSRQVQERVDQARKFEAHCFERTRPAGTVIEIRGVPMPKGGFLTIYTDITERKEREATLESMVVDAQEAQARIEAQAAELVVQAESLSVARDAAMSAAAAKSDFLANMSHELRTPLNAMLGFAGLIEQESHGPIGHEKYAEYISIIGQSGHHLLTVINDILDYSKIEAGKLTLDPVPFELSQVADSTVQLLASAAHEKAIELACFVGPEVPMNLIGDPGRIRQVLLNLAGNAIKFTETGGVRIDITLEGLDEDDIVLCIKIADTGIGIAEDEQQNLFDKFSQADVSTTRKYGGTGLGLAICKQLVELMKGRIGVESRPGQGSTFWFTVVLARQADAGKSTLAKIKEAMQGQRALVVGSNRIYRAVCTAYLEMLGVEAVTANDAAAALPALDEAASLTPFEVAIIDHAMRGVDGEELCRRIRADARHDNLKMVLSSSSGLVLSHRNAQELGFDAALSRPLHRTAVLDCLGHLYDVVLPADGVEGRESNATVPEHLCLRILVAEDNKINQLLLDTMLRGAGYAVDVANNGQEAVEAVQAHDYDLVLMDMHMPELNGLEATRRIRLMPGKAAEVPVIAVTAAVMGEDREKCHNAGMNDFVSKPIDKYLLFEKIAFWTHTEISANADSPEDNAKDGNAELSGDAAAALDDLLGTMDGLTRETG